MTRCPLFEFRPIYKTLLDPVPPMRCCGSCRRWDREREVCRERRDWKGESIGEKRRREVRLKNY